MTKLMAGSLAPNMTDLLRAFTMTGKSATDSVPGIAQFVIDGATNSGWVADVIVANAINFL